MAETVETDWLTVEEAAKAAGVPVAMIIEWIKQGKVTAYYFVSETGTVH